MDFLSGPATIERVQDLLSGETLFSVKCTDDCEAVKLSWVKSAFDYVTNNASEPVELDKAYALVESKSSPESAPATQWDAKGNPIPDPKHPPKSAPQRPTPKSIQKQASP